METQSIPEPLSHDKRVFLNGKQLAKVLDVTPPALSDAVKNGNNCGGYPVGEWALESETGRVKGYEVPEFILEDKDPNSEKRTNPEENSLNKAKIKLNKGQKPENQPQTVTHNNNYSLLPEGEDYVRPVGMVSLPSVVKKALEYDTPQSCAVITGGLVGIGAIIGHATTENAIGALIGAAAGLGISYLSYNYFEPSKNLSKQSNIPIKKYTQQIIQSHTNQPNQSGYLVN